MRLYSFDLPRFRQHVEDDPTAELIPLDKERNPWLLLSYRREEMLTISDETRGTGSFDYGHVYRNKKGRYTLVGLAENDWEALNS